MTYTVSSGTLNSTIPYHTCLVGDAVIDCAVFTTLQTISELQRSITAAKQRLKKMSEHKASVAQWKKDNERELSRAESDVKAQLSQLDRPPPPQVTLPSSLINRL